MVIKCCVVATQTKLDLEVSELSSCPFEPQVPDQSSGQLGTRGDPECWIFRFAGPRPNRHKSGHKSINNHLYLTL